jgi:hypothetical protein
MAKPARMLAPTASHHALDQARELVHEPQLDQTREQNHEKT